MRRLIREPLLHFFILGALLFALYGWLHRGLPNSQGEIVVTRGQLQSLQAQFEKIWRRPATQKELQGLVDNWVREEIFYREGIAMGLDRDDPVVRRRIGQKVEFLAEGLAPAVPTTADLQAWLDAHPDNYRIEPAYSLRQVYFNPARHREKLQTDIASARSALESGRPFAGDATMLPPSLEKAPAFEIGRIFGNEFSDALNSLPAGSWQGPVRSGFGLHLVRIDAKDGGRRATLDEARAAVERDYLHARAEEGKSVFYAGLRAKYTIRIEPAGAIAVPQN